MGKKYLCTPKPGYTYVRIKGRYIGRITAPEGTAEFERQIMLARAAKKMRDGG